MITKPKIYTEEFVKEKVSQALDIIENDEGVVFIGQLAEKTDWFYRQLWSEWRTDFAYCEQISETIKKVDSIVESRNVTGGINSKLNPTMVIFNLKNNYGWKDQQSLDHTTKGESLNQIKLTIVDGTQHPEALSEPVHEQD